MQSRKFFHKPHEVKAQVVNPPGPNPQRGWSGVGVETTSRLADDPRSRMLKDTKVIPPLKHDRKIHLANKAIIGAL